MAREAGALAIAVVEIGARMNAVLSPMRGAEHIRANWICIKAPGAEAKHPVEPRSAAGKRIEQTVHDPSLLALEILPLERCGRRSRGIIVADHVAIAESFEHHGIPGVRAARRISQECLVGPLADGAVNAAGLVRLAITKARRPLPIHLCAMHQVAGSHGIEAQVLAVGDTRLRIETLGPRDKGNGSVRYGRFGSRARYRLAGVPELGRLAVLLCVLVAVGLVRVRKAGAVVPVIRHPIQVDIAYRLGDPASVARGPGGSAPGPIADTVLVVLIDRATTQDGGDISSRRQVRFGRQGRRLNHTRCDLAGPYERGASGVSWAMCGMHGVPSFVRQRCRRLSRFDPRVGVAGFDGVKRLGSAHDLDRSEIPTPASLRPHSRFATVAANRDDRPGIEKALDSRKGEKATGRVRDTLSDDDRNRRDPDRITLQLEKRQIVLPAHAVGFCPIGAVGDLVTRT